jgi:uncharacterized RDD family membrane protein YckC
MLSDHERGLSPRPIPTGPESFPPTGPNSLASIRRRALARFLDSAIVFVAWLGILRIGWTALGEPDMEESRKAAAFFAVWFVLSVAYETAFVCWRGQTLGKLVTGTRVARQVDGRYPLWWHAAIRVVLPDVILIVAFPVSIVLVSVIYGIAAWDPMRRGLHDKAAGTVVVNAR